MNRFREIKNSTPDTRMTIEAPIGGTGLFTSQRLWYLRLGGFSEPFGWQFLPVARNKGMLRDGVHNRDTWKTESVKINCFGLQLIP